MNTNMARPTERGMGAILAHVRVEGWSYKGPYLKSLQALPQQPHAAYMGAHMDERQVILNYGRFMKR